MPRAKKKVVEDAAAVPKDDVRLALMKRIYVSRDPESTPATWLHHPDCPPKEPDCKRYGCKAFSGLDVEPAIDAGWWNDVPGDD